MNLVETHFEHGRLRTTQLFNNTHANIHQSWISRPNQFTRQRQAATPIASAPSLPSSEVFIFSTVPSLTFVVHMQSKHYNHFGLLT